MDIHTTNLGPGGTEQPTETNFVAQQTPFQTFVGQITQHKTYKKYAPFILLASIVIPLGIIAFR